MLLEEFEEKAVEDRFEGWELVEFLQVPVHQVLLAAYQNDWINDVNFPELLEFLGIER